MRAAKSIARILDTHYSLCQATNELIEAVAIHVNIHGADGYVLARLADARAALAKATASGKGE